MTLTFDPLTGTDSPLRRLDPRWKLAGLGLAALAAAFVQTVPAALLALAGSLVLVLVSRLPPRWYLARVGAVALVLVPFACLFPLLVGGAGWTLGPLRFSSAGFALAVLLGAKAVAVVSLTFVLLASSPLDATLKAAHALRVPGLLVQLGILTYRYLFVLSDELARLRVALRVRGYRNRANLHSYRTVGHVAGTLLVRGHERAERVGQAMRCRGFDGQFRSLASFQTRAVDVVVFALVVAGALGVLVLDWIEAWGRGV
jgi:cobalt/nickel transport system permease protein